MAAFCWVMVSICATALLTCDRPSSCSLPAVLMSASSALTCVTERSTSCIRSWARWVCVLPPATRSADSEIR